MQADERQGDWARARADRYAEDLDNLFAGVMATINRHRDKPPLETMTIYEIAATLSEEKRELVDALYSALEQLRAGVEPDPQTVEREAYDLCVVSLAAFMFARHGFTSRPPRANAVSNYHLGEE